MYKYSIMSILASSLGKIIVFGNLKTDLFETGDTGAGA